MNNLFNVTRLNVSRCFIVNNLVQRRLWSNSGSVHPLTLSGSRVMTGCKTLAPTLTRGALLPDDHKNHITGQLYSQKRFYMRRKTIKIPPTKVLNFDYGGDLTYGDYPLDLAETRVELEGAKELERVDELTRRLLSMEYSDGQAKLKRKIQNLLSKVKEHPLDLRSLEVAIAYQTIAIRNHIRHVNMFRKDKAAKCLLVLRLQSRRKRLKKLRSMDFDKFSWLCEELQMKYVPTPQYNRKPSKAKVAKRQARDAAFTAMKEKMEQFKINLAKEREIFAEYKQKELDKIEAEIKDLDLDEESRIVNVYKTLRDGDILELDGKIHPLKPRGQSILEHKFKLAEVINKQREAERENS